MEADRPRVEHVLVEVGLSIDGIMEPGTRYWLVEDFDGRTVGTVGLELGDGAALLRSAAVHPFRRSQGIGRNLVERALATARDVGCRHVYLFSTGAGAYWQRLGFHEVPVAEVASALPKAPQVMKYTALGSLASEVAWRRELG